MQAGVYPNVVDAAGVYPNVVDAAGSICKACGPRGLFTGYLPTLLEDVPDMACKFAAYETMRSLHRNFVGGRKASATEDFAMGAVSGAFAAAATTPLDVIKTHMMCTAASRPSMLSSSRIVWQAGGAKQFFKGVPLAVCIRSVQAGVYPNVVDAAGSICKACGPWRLFTGYLPTLLEDVPDMACKFTAYETMRSLHRNFVGGRKASATENFAMGAISGASAAAATMLLDVIKTHMMCTAASRASILSSTRIVWQVTIRALFINQPCRVKLWPSQLDS
ncbi:hypothetical protein WJX84_004600 [Apatococcus fuscideae]|uniref:Mitochondrial carrier protein n=1 Tax=Apatococcus fuscideae TaxID=2026836 RepID=A0AAW1S556_9CHLO